MSISRGFCVVLILDTFQFIREKEYRKRVDERIKGNNSELRNARIKSKIIKERIQ